MSVLILLLLLMQWLKIVVGSHARGFIHPALLSNSQTPPVANETSGRPGTHLGT